MDLAISLTEIYVTETDPYPGGLSDEGELIEKDVCWKACHC
jgi:hypothetical protein